VVGDGWGRKSGILKGPFLEVPLEKGPLENREKMNEVSKSSIGYRGEAWVRVGTWVVKKAIRIKKEL